MVKARLPPQPRVPVAPERRQRIRIVGKDVRGLFDDRLPFRVLDLSEGGLCVESGRPLPYHPGVTLRFDQANLVVPVRVVWSRLVLGGAPRYRSGIQLVEPTFEQIRALLDLAAR